MSVQGSTSDLICMEEFEEPFTWQQVHERYGEIPKFFVCVLGKARRFADGAPVSQLLHWMNVLPAIADNVCMGLLTFPASWKTDSAILRLSRMP